MPPPAARRRSGNATRKSVFTKAYAREISTAPNTPGCTGNSSAFEITDQARLPMGDIHARIAAVSIGCRIGHPGTYTQPGIVDQNTGAVTKASMRTKGIAVPSQGTAPGLIAHIPMRRNIDIDLARLAGVIFPTAATHSN